MTAKTPFNTDTFTIKACAVKEGWTIWIEHEECFRKVVEIIDQTNDENDYGFWLLVDVSDDPTYTENPWKQHKLSIEYELLEPVIVLKNPETK